MKCSWPVLCNSEYYLANRILLFSVSEVAAMKQTKHKPFCKASYIYITSQ